jgi:peptidoglycan/LPS O-acetylase OafA/YrhL
MFGFLRALWALMVVFGHIFWVSDFGRFAVFGFYILSGYLMTYVMHNSYGYSTSGIKSFAISRALRLYPGYWVACLLSIGLLLSLSDFMLSASYHTIAIPESALSIGANFSMIFPHWLPNQIEPRLSPATWALTVELFFYAAIALGISKTLPRTLIWLGLSLAFIALSYALELYWHARYFSIFAGALPFSLGALIFFIKDHSILKTRMTVILKRPAILLSLMMSISLSTSFGISRGFSGLWVEVIFYGNMLISWLLVLSLAQGYSLSDRIGKRWDKMLGDYSYPFYILHYQAAMIVSVIVYGKMDILKGDLSPITLLSYFATLLLLCFTLINLFDKPVETLRQGLKGKSLKTKETRLKYDSH